MRGLLSNVEIHWKFQLRGTLKTVGLFTYRNNKIIGVVAGGSEETPIDYLAGMATSLDFKTTGKGTVTEIPPNR